MHSYTLVEREDSNLGRRGYQQGGSSGRVLRRLSVLCVSVVFFIQSQSAFFQQMESRLKPLAQLEEFLDSNKIIFRYNSKVHTFSVIRADYLLQNDFNSSSLEGVRIAVEMFQEETGIRLCKVPLADLCGTLVIIKP